MAAKITETVSKLLDAVDQVPTGAGLVADVKLVARIAGVPFTTLVATVQELAVQFGLEVVEQTPEKKSTTTSTDDESSFDAWAQRTIEANASSSIFGEDDTIAQQHLVTKS